MILQSAQQVLLGKKMTTEAMMSDAATRAAKVDLFRRYYDGEQEQSLTDEMRKVLRIEREGEDGIQDNFNLNYCQLIIDSAADRLSVVAVESDNEAADQWVQTLMERNGFDDFQGDVHQATLIDADTFVGVWPDPDTGEAILTHEMAFDGISGIVPIYKSDDIPELAAVMKFWHVLTDNGTITDDVRLNIYFEDRIERYISRSSAPFKPYENVDKSENPVDFWTTTSDETGEPVGIPFVHFRNRRRKNYGLSELENAVGPQDALNRMMYDIIISAELSAFMIRYVIGGKLSSNAIMPGVFLEISPGGLDKDQQVSIGSLEPGSPDGFIQAANWIIQNLARVSNTPLPDFDGGDNASGEALKAREARFIGKLLRFQTKIGSAWEHVFDLAHKIETVFASIAKRPPAYKRWVTKWRDPQIRSDKDVIDNILKVTSGGIVSKRAALSVAAGVFGWDKATIDRILAELEDEATQRAAELAAQVPGNDNFSNPQDNPNDAPPFGKKQGDSQPAETDVQSE